MQDPIRPACPALIRSAQVGFFVQTCGYGLGFCKPVRGGARVVFLKNLGDLPSPSLPLINPYKQKKTPNNLTYFPYLLRCSRSLPSFSFFSSEVQSLLHPAALHLLQPSPSLNQSESLSPSLHFLRNCWCFLINQLVRSCHFFFSLILCFIRGSLIFASGSLIFSLRF
jgi:hypothetical protein